MKKDLTTSRIDRQNILNNDLAVAEIKKSAKIKCIPFGGKFYLTKNMVSSFFGVELRTIERYVSDNADELLQNGYEIIKGRKLKQFIEVVNLIDVPDINVGNISSKTPQLAIFDFKSFLNIAMLLAIRQIDKTPKFKKKTSDFRRAEPLFYYDAMRQ